MKFEISTKQLTDISAQSLVVGLFEDGQFTETEVALDMAAKGLLSELATNKTFFSKETEVIRFHRPEGLNVSELVVVNLGKIENFDENEFFMETTMGNLTIKGEGLEIIKLDTYQGNVSIKGKADSITYTEDGTKEKESSFLGKLFK